MSVEFNHKIQLGTVGTGDIRFRHYGTNTGHLDFYSEDGGSIALSIANPNWDGEVECSTDYGNVYMTWDGTQIEGEHIWLRGTGNTRFATSTTAGEYSQFTMTGTNIHIDGNIENLLDYATVDAGGHPTMADYCYAYMFSSCTSLTTIPTGLLPAETMADSCYRNMFYGCTGLTTIPADLLPATTLASYCYYYMFYGCTSLTTIPALPATTLASVCYALMFGGCTSLTTIPADLLPATTLASYCYAGMFGGCTSLTTIPAGLLPATTLSQYCYAWMFYNCTSLTTIPALPATTLASVCYNSMFYGCSSIKLSRSQTGAYQTAYRIPSSGTGTTATSALGGMFYGTGGSWTGTPSINTTYYTSNTVV